MSSPRTNDRKSRSNIIIALPQGRTNIALSPQLSTANALIENKSDIKMENEINLSVDNTDHINQESVRASTYIYKDEEHKWCKSCQEQVPIKFFRFKEKDCICNACRYKLYEKSMRRLLFGIYRNHIRWSSGILHYSRDQFMKCVYSHEDFHKAYVEWASTDFFSMLRPSYFEIDYRKPFTLDNLYLENKYDSEDKSMTLDPLMIDFVRGFVK